MIAAVIVLVIALAGFATAATIQVPAGTGTLQAAIDAASPGDRLVLVGAYDGAIVDVPRLRIRGNSPTTISGGTAGLTVRAERVRVEGDSLGSFYVVGPVAGIVVENTDDVRLKRLLAGVGGPAGGSGETGIVIRASTRTTVDRAHVRGSSVGIQLADLPVGSRTLLRHSEFFSAGTVALIENCAPGAALRRAKIFVKECRLQGFSNDDTGIALRNSDGIEVVRTGLQSVAIAVDLDASSDNNLFHRSSLGSCVVNDAGTGNVFEDLIDCP